MACARGDAGRVFSRLSGGDAGRLYRVDIFFVISGFLIIGIIVRELDQQHFGLLTFYTRRIRRIFPALILVLGVTLVLGWLWMLPATYAQLSADVFASAAFVSNIALLLQSGYFDIESGKKPLRRRGVSRTPRARRINAPAAASPLRRARSSGPRRRRPPPRSHCFEPGRPRLSASTDIFPAAVRPSGLWRAVHLHRPRS
jgi:hypothetical protein